MRLCCSKSWIGTALRQGFFRILWIALIGGASQIGVSQELESTQVKFQIFPTNLSDALQSFSDQADLQLLYEQNAVAAKTSAGLQGEYTAAAALEILLKNTGLNWRLINGRTVAISAVELSDPKGMPQEQAPPSPIEVTVLADVDVVGQQPWWIGTGSSSDFGVPKPLVETPRAVSHISGDAISLFSLSAVEDLLRVVPGVFTTTRFGVQGSVDIRNIPADTYFRGMKRLTLQGHGRSVMAAMDTIEVVGGPAPPLHGLGKTGGYVNMVPKSGRSRTGQYLTDPSGFVQVIAGDYERREVSFSSKDLGKPALVVFR